MCRDPLQPFEILRHKAGKLQNNCKQITHVVAIFNYIFNYFCLL